MVCNHWKAETKLVGLAETSIKLNLTARQEWLSNINTKWWTRLVQQEKMSVCWFLCPFHKTRKVAQFKISPTPLETYNQNFSKFLIYQFWLIYTTFGIIFGWNIPLLVPYTIFGIGCVYQYWFMYTKIGIHSISRNFWFGITHPRIKILNICGQNP